MRRLIRMYGRSVPLIIVASSSAYAADQIAARLRRNGAVVYATHSADGCLRVATSVAADLVLLDPALASKRLEQLLHAHPTSGHARIMHLSATVMADLSHATQSVLAAA